MSTPLTQNDVNYNLMAFSEKTEYSRLVAELYLPALATALRFTSESDTEYSWLLWCDEHPPTPQ